MLTQVVADVCDTFLRVTGLPEHVMQPAFGMAEVCTCMTYNNIYSAGSNLRVTKASLQVNELRVVAESEARAGEALAFMDLGPASPGVEIRICAEDGVTALRERQVGRFQIKGACVMKGYHDHPQANAESFVGDGWFDSGDLGFLHDGRLYLTGRAKEVIIIRGANYYCYEVEDVVTQVPGTVAARVAATSAYNDSIGTEELLLFFVPDAEVVSEAAVAMLERGEGLLPEVHALISAVRTHVTKVLSLSPRCVIPVIDEKFHRTTSGKIQRGAFLKDFKSGLHARALAALDGARNSKPSLSTPLQQPPAVAGHARGTLSAAVADDRGRCAYQLGWELLQPPDSFSSSVPIPFSAVRCIGRLRDSVLWGLLAASRQDHGSHALAKPSDPGRRATDPASARAIALLLESVAVALPESTALVSLLFEAYQASREAPLMPLMVFTQGSAVADLLSCQPTGGGVAHGGVWGCIGVLRKEHATWHVAQVDMVAPCRCTPADSSATVNAIRAAAYSQEVDVVVRGGVRLLPRLRLRDTPSTLSLKTSSTETLRGPVAITGGLGGLGMRLAPWLLSRGVRSIALFSRSGTLARDASQPGHGGVLPVQGDYPSATVDVLCGDASHASDVLAATGILSPMHGWLHLSDVLRPQRTNEVSTANFLLELAPKAVGASRLSRRRCLRPQSSPRRKRRHIH